MLQKHHRGENDTHCYEQPCVSYGNIIIELSSSIVGISVK